MVNPENLEIQIDFDQALDLTTVDVSTFKVFGRWTGPRIDLTISMDNEDKQVTLLMDTQADPFNAGEWVTVSLNKGIKGANGEFMSKGFSWNFWIETKTGSLIQEKTKTIELRQAGETWLQTYGAYAGDLDNDGFSDLTIVNENTDDLRILLNDKTGDYKASDLEVYPMGEATPSPNEGADFNFDGDIDFAVCTAHDNELRVLFGDGEGSFYQKDDYTTGTNARGLAVLDFNGDGAEDIAIANRGTSNMTLFENDGSGEFSSINIDFDLSGEGESGLVAVDGNNDGMMDLFVGNYTSQEVAFLQGDGSGGFFVSSKTSLGGEDRPWMLAAGDFDGDGFADVASANAEGNSVTILLNDGNSSFQNFPLRLTHPDGLFPLAIDAGDLDGDGDLDLLVSYYSSVSYIVFENDGTGNFQAATVLKASKNASCAILHDRDNDGDLDISATDEGDDLLFLFENKEIENNVRSIIESLNSLTMSPNPYREEVQIEFELEESENMKLEVLDIEGKHVITLWEGKLSPGKRQWMWDGHNALGYEVSTGVYIVQMTLGKKLLSEKLIRK